MNLGLYRTRFALAALAVVAALLGWSLSSGKPFGSRDPGNVAFLLTSGWLAVAAYVALAAYAARRAAHRLRLSPEFAWKAKLPDLERAQSALTELQNRIVRRELGGTAAVRREADRILRQFGVHRVLAVAIEPDPAAAGLLRLATTPRQPIGRLAAWLQVHVWLGIAAALLVWWHGGLRSGSTMGLLLNGLSLAVIGTGLLGAALWTFGPTWLTRQERELSVEKVHALEQHFRRKVAAAAAALREADEAAAAALRRDLATLTGQQELVQREARRLWLWREALRLWRLVHVPCSTLLLALVGIHILAVWYY
ncbi:MAG: hypothetical protein KF830_11200 [Planctomycetes bacterium]|nr:hypothetical protein [Planctomycetota bacterium]